MLPEALSEALGVSLSEVLDLYFSESDQDKRGCLIGEALDRKMLGEWDQEWLEEEARKREATELLSYEKDDTF
jgi:hypothetical protein